MLGRMDMVTLLQGQKIFWLYENEPCMIFTPEVRSLNFLVIRSMGMFISNFFLYYDTEILLKLMSKVPVATPFFSAGA